MKLRSSFTAGPIALCAMPLALLGQNETPLIPMGSLSAFPTVVQTGTHPTLTWDVTLPERVTDVVTIQEPGTIIPKRNLIMDVRVLGASVKRVWTNSNGNITKWEWVPTQALLNYNSNGYSQVFFNTHDKINPNHLVKSQVVTANSTINFGGRYEASSSSWSTLRTSTNSQHNVVALKDGDTPPTTTPLYQQPTLESFLLPYLDEVGNINLGARDVIYLMELTHTDRNHGGFDLQDLVLLVTFYDEVTTQTSGNGNNGHGNNTDGVDSSNPGNAPFTDSDPNVDDEASGGGRGRRKK